MIGGALGGVESMVFPGEGVGFWPLISMGAIPGGTMRCPFTGVQRLYPVVDGEGKLTGVVTRKDIHALEGSTRTLADVIKQKPVTAFPDEPLRVVVYRMAETGLTRMPVVDREKPRDLLGMISLNDLLQARTRNLEEERRRERILCLRFPIALARNKRVS